MSSRGSFRGRGRGLGSIAVPKCICEGNQALVDEISARAEQKREENSASHLHLTLKRAAQEVAKLPHALESGAHARRLKVKYIGPVIATMIDQIMNIADESSPAVANNVAYSSNENQDGESDTSACDLLTHSLHQGGRRKDGTRSTSTRTYVPRYRSGAYAILLAMVHDADASMRKAEVIANSQQYCDTSFVESSASTHYNAWSSMKILLKKGLIAAEGNPKRFMLTDDGVQLGHRILAYHHERIQQPTGSPSNEIEAIDRAGTGELTNHVAHTETRHRKRSSKKPMTNHTIVSNENANRVNADRIERLSVHVRRPVPRLSVSAYEIVLLVDNRERFQDDRLTAIRQLTSQGVIAEVAALPLGDLVWIAKPRDAVDFDDAIILYPIIERKTCEDLASSIVDGRFEDQKFRLSTCGITEVCYLIEGDLTNPQNLPLDTLRSAISETDILNGFYVHQTKNFASTIKFLCKLTEAIKRRFMAEGVPETPITLALLAEKSSRSVHIDNNLFGMQLMSINGISAPKAQALVSMYPSARAIYDSFAECTTIEEEQSMLKEVEFRSNGNIPRKVGTALGKRIRDFFRDPNYRSPRVRPSSRSASIQIVASSSR